ncbi:MAG: hypothetical protein ACREB3_17320, partial [Burkholderiales bacterium]
GLVSCRFLLDGNKPKPTRRRLCGAVLVATCAFAVGCFILVGAQFALPLKLSAGDSPISVGVWRTFDVPHASAEIVLTSFEPRTPIEAVLSEVFGSFLVLFIGFSGTFLIARGTQMVIGSWPANLRFWCVATALGLPLLCFVIAGARIYARSASTVLHEHYFGTGVVVLDLFTLALLKSHTILPFVGQTLLGGVVGFWFVQTLAACPRRTYSA